MSQVWPSLIWLIIILQTYSVLAVKESQPISDSFRDIINIHQEHDNQIQKIRDISGDRANSLRKKKFYFALPRPPAPTDRSCLLLDSSAGYLGGYDVQHRILLFLDTNFVILYKNWHAHFLDICGAQRLHRLELVCMDPGTQPYLAAIGLNCSFHSFDLKLMDNVNKSSGLYIKQAAVWMKRVEIIVSYLQRGVDLIISDIDAIWLSDPFVDLSFHRNQGAQVVASRGRWPQSLSSRWGATLCMGFIYLRGTAFTVELMRATLKDMAAKLPTMQRTEFLSNAINIFTLKNISAPLSLQTEFHNLQKLEGNKPDDQYSINYVLNNWGIVWNNNIKLPYEASDNYSLGVVSRDGVNHSLVLLPHFYYTRNCSRGAQNIRMKIAKQKQQFGFAKVMHCMSSPAKPLGKMVVLYQQRLWHENAPSFERQLNLSLDFQLPQMRKRRRKKKRRIES